MQFKDKPGTEAGEFGDKRALPVDKSEENGTLKGDNCPEVSDGGNTGSGGRASEVVLKLGDEILPAALADLGTGVKQKPFKQQ